MPIKFRTFSRRLTAIALATAAAATMSVGAAQSASAANPPDSGLGGQGAGDGPVGPSGCRGDCGPYQNPPRRPRDPIYCAYHSGPQCHRHPQDMTSTCSTGPQHAGYCLPPAPAGSQLPVNPDDQARQDYCLSHLQDPSCGHASEPGTVTQEIERFSVAMHQCDAGDAVDCDYIHTHSMPVLPGSHTDCGTSTPFGTPVVVYDPTTGAPTRCDTPPAEVDCAKTPQNAACDPDGHWCYDHPEDPNCAGVTGTYCDEHPDAAECNIDQAPGLAAADNANVDNGADNGGAANDAGVNVIDDGAGMAGAGQ